jgi:hypothetical protein
VGFHPLENAAFPRRTPEAAICERRLSGDHSMAWLRAPY